jgi:DNA-3-methyladenine glycosylase I
MADPGIVRNRLKIESTLHNAERIVEVQKVDGSFAEYVWSFVEGTPIAKRWRSLSEIPSETTESEAMSKALKRRGFRFVGPTVCYAFMQAVGMVNDHTVDCFRFKELWGMQ